MSDTPTKTYSPEFLQRLIADHEAEQAGATSEASSAADGRNSMSDIKQCTNHDTCAACRRCDELQSAVASIVDQVQRLIADPSQRKSRPTDEDIWREAFMALLSKNKMDVDEAVEDAHQALAVYLEWWPR